MVKVLKSSIREAVDQTFSRKHLASELATLPVLGKKRAPGNGCELSTLFFYGTVRYRETSTVEKEERAAVRVYISMLRAASSISSQRRSGIPSATLQQRGLLPCDRGCNRHLLSTRFLVSPLKPHRGIYNVVARTNGSAIFNTSFWDVRRVEWVGVRAGVSASTVAVVAVRGREKK